MKIYTKTGDSGETGLFRGPRVSKNDPRVRAYGNVDELNALLGLAITAVQHPEIRSLLSSLQQDLFEVGADLATPPQPSEEATLRIPASLVERLEREIDRYEELLPQLQNFILPGGSRAGALLHLARTVCRRAERAVTRLRKEQSMNPEILRYLNRLSDLLFVLARTENQKSGSPEVAWKKRNR
ncbi:MAG TPA: cob(I)yrinic acid a,c-diamide adenosyltransferase [Acidobacteriota bacterium]